MAYMEERSSFVGMPKEIIIQILRFLDALSLGKVELVCSTLRRLTIEAYKDACGPSPLHRLAHCHSKDCQQVSDNCLLRLKEDYRKIAIEQLKHDRKQISLATANEPRLTPRVIFGITYTCNDDMMQGIASDALLKIRKFERDDIWTTVVASALHAQGRQQEASRYYSQLFDSAGFLPESTIWTAANWGWPFDLPLPETASHVVLEEALICAAAHGNESMLAWLHGKGVSLGVIVKFSSAACVAARAGHTHILRFLHDNGVDLLGAPPERWSPLCEAVANGHSEATEYLLKAYANANQPVGSKVINLIGSIGQVDVLRLILRHIPTLASTREADGLLLIGSAIRYHHIDFVRVFVMEGQLDIHQADLKGRTAFYLAVESEDRPMIEAVIALGASIGGLDSTGQTALEHAVSCNNSVAPWLCQLASRDLARIKQRKLDQIKDILQITRAGYLRQLAKLHENISAEELAKQWRVQNMDEKLSQIWIRKFSIEALDWHERDFLHEPLISLYRRIVRLCWEAPAGLIATHGNSSLGEADRDKLVELALKHVAVLPNPYGIIHVNQAAFCLIQDASTVDLKELIEHLDTPCGRFFMAGMSAKFLEERGAKQKFIESFGE